MAYRVGVDIGGTFTDFCAFDDETNQLHTLKVLSTPDRPGSEVMTGIAALHERYGVVPSSIEYFTHGTTVGVNTVIQRKGVRLALFTTENFVDVLEVARLKMPDPYSLHSRRPEPLITKERVFPVRERLRADGREDLPVDEASVLAALDGARARGAEGIVVALINAYRNPAHEHQVKAIVERAAPGLPVFCSSDVWSIIREYERTTTAVIHGYVQPRVSHYLTSLQRALAEVGVPAEPLVTKSNGGVMSAELGKSACVQMILSGTAAGVIGASFVARLSGFTNTMSLDIGGTSADVAFIRDGMPQYGVGEVIGEFPIYIPSVAVTSIGAGGGSIAWVDELGVLKVGPESAGSTPGPACYGRGGERPTITDAFVALGYIGQFDLGYSAITIDVERARQALRTVADPIGRTVEETAQAIIDIAVSGMYMEVSKLVSHYGMDPRDFAMQAFGGAGPMMACFLARELGMANVVVPPTPGVLSALGGLIADIKNDFISTVFIELDDSVTGRIRDGFAELERQAVHWLREEQHYQGDYRLVYSADMRYRGQSFEIECTLDAGDVAAGNVAGMAEAFHREHEQVYEHADREAPVQIINLRMVIVGLSPKPRIPATEPVDAQAEPERSIEVFVDGTRQPIPIYAREKLRAGHRLDGPCVIAQSDCTTCVPGGYAGRVDRFGNLVLTFGAAGAGLGEGGN
ncbi:MAG: hydantoinase/oxoprolinase family protein [Ectothiorhodospiraceae bacterium]|nr:hydantoinase/oxoprolinase family protein [Chromatiales bacterium]MCP5155702.1 hydantoinase/oxoprolinase family protein [Ectothiorhodospiraceae bacterium]